MSVTEPSEVVNAGMAIQTEGCPLALSRKSLTSVTLVGQLREWFLACFRAPWSFKTLGTTHLTTCSITNSCDHPYWENIMNTEKSKSKSCWEMSVVWHTLTGVLSIICELTQISLCVLQDTQRVVFVRYSSRIRFLKGVFLFFNSNNKIRYF